MTRLQLSLGATLALSLLAFAAGCADDGESPCTAGELGCGVDAAVGAAVPPTTGGVSPSTGGGPGGPVPPIATMDASLPPNPSNGLPPNRGGGLTGGLAGLGGLLGRDGGGIPGFGGLPAGGFTAGGLPAGGGAAGAGDGGMLPPTSGGGTMPVIPEISGECPAMQNGTVMVAGHRGVQLTVGAANKMGALLFFWHGTGGSASQVSMVPASARNEIISSGGVIASFNGRDSSGSAGDCSGTRAHNIADFNAADQIVACAVKNHGIDPRRIYTTGCSAGGLQSGCMAQLRSNYIAASAPNSGGVTFNQRWQSAGKPAIFTMHGGPQDMVGVAFSQTSATLDMSAKQHGSFVVNCNHGGGHCIAPSALYQAAWTFMKDHPYGADSPWKNGIPAGVPDYCKIF